MKGLQHIFNSDNKIFKWCDQNKANFVYKIPTGIPKWDKN